MDLDQVDRPNEVLYGRRFAPHANDHADAGELGICSYRIPRSALGAKRDNNRYFRGAMDEVKVFNGALTDDQVLSLKNTNVIPEPSTLLVLASGGVLGLLLTGRRSLVDARRIQMDNC